ncbi:class I SAM-dependent methyltransferase [bacterium]|nr:class I SAM-dependent methyltransferase [bacterium]
MSDTFQRSCEHWSEESRHEMEHFYALASVDYKHLAEAFDWKKWLKSRQGELGPRRLKLLDVACGSGKFPMALTQYAEVDDSTVSPIDYALLDPSEFSLAEARQALTPPFQAGAEYQTTIQALACERGEFDIVWATHALYAVAVADLQAALERFVYATSGAGFIAHAGRESHYLRFYQHYLDGFKSGTGVPFSSGEQIVETLERMGVGARVEQISYYNGAPEGAERQIEGYLQRCIFDDTISLDAMRNNPLTGPYLDTCLQDGQWRFEQQVMLIFL